MNRTTYILAGVIFFFGYLGGIVVSGIAPRISEHNVSIILNFLGFPAVLVFIEYRLRHLSDVSVPERQEPEVIAKTVKLVVEPIKGKGTKKNAVSEVSKGTPANENTNGTSKRRPVARRLS